MFPNKCTTREQAQARYGAIDLVNGVWTQESMWVSHVDVTAFVFPNFTIMDSGNPVQRILCNKDMAAPLSMAFAALKEAGLGVYLKTFDGCLNVRAVRGSTLVSTHAYALGIDLNAASNPLWATTGGFYDLPEFVKCFTDQGFDWGGTFHGRKDPMHFSRAFEGHA